MGKSRQDEGEFRALMEKVRAGDEEATMDLFERYRPGIWAMARKILTRYKVYPRDCEDVKGRLVGAGIAKFFLALRKYDYGKTSIGNFTSYSRECVKNEMLNEMKRITRTWGNRKTDENGIVTFERREQVAFEDLEDVLEAQEGEASVLEKVMSREIFEKTEAYRKSLGPRDRLMFTLYRENLLGRGRRTNAEITEELRSRGFRMSREGVRRRIHDKFDADLRLLLKDLHHGA